MYVFLRSWSLLIVVVSFYLVRPSFSQSNDISATVPDSVDAQHYDPVGSLDTSAFSTTRWCKDSGTLCWSKKRKWLNGVRIVSEPKLGTVFGGGGDRIESNSFGELSIIGFEFNIKGAWVATQIAMIAPGTVKLDVQSETVVKGYLNDPDLVANGELTENKRTVDVDYGLSLGLTFFDGLLAVGVGYLDFDERDFFIRDDDGRVMDDVPWQDKSDFYTFFSLQPVSSLRAAFKQAK